MTITSSGWAKWIAFVASRLSPGRALIVSAVPHRWRIGWYIGRMRAWKVFCRPWTSEMFADASPLNYSTRAGSARS